ncbi:MAG: PAS domain S-box protein, partial [Syntrophales bacterium LBB04]|nr:PAS domain S-box protein [Syntrophales bacterium LBB04]
MQELSPSLERLAKFKRNELIGESIYKLYASPEEREDFLKVMMKTGRVNDYEITMKDKDGEFVTCSLCSRLVFNEKGVPHKIVGSMRDITKRKQAERALWESERRLSDIIDFLPDATFVIDREGKVIAWNRAIEEITGFRAEDMVGKGDYEYALPFYGIRRPILIDLVFELSEDIEKKYSFVKKRGNVLLAETAVNMKEVACVLWGITGPLCDSRGNIVGAIE